jgi:sugar phosphate isomerase/epimerase
MSWRYAIATHAVRGLIAEAGFEGFLDRAAEAGFDGIDLSDSALPVDRPGTDWTPVLRAATARGLKVAALNLLHAGLSYPDHAADSVARARSAIDAAAALSADVVSISLALPDAVGDGNAYRGGDYVMGSTREATVGDYERTAAHLARLVEEAASAGVALSIEVHHASVADTGASTLRIWRMVGDDRLGVNPDVVNVYWSYAEPEEDWRETLRLLAPLTNLWHVKNVRRTVRGGRATYVNAPLGDGDIDYAEAAAIMRRAGFSGWVSLERGGPDGDSFQTACDGMDFLRRSQFAEQGDR